MPRSKEFDVDEALDRAVDVFRRRGFEGASMAELQVAMGIGRQSIYDTFGDKKHLFVRALDRYTAQGRASLAASLSADDASLAALRGHLEGLIRFLTPREPSGSCLVAAAIVEVGPQDSDVASRCRKNEGHVRGAIRAALRRAVERGEVREDLDVDAASLMIMGQVYGMSVLARNGASRRELRRVVDQVLGAL